MIQVKMKTRVWILFVWGILCPSLQAQMVTTDPAIPTMGQEIKVYFDSSQDDGDLYHYTGDIYVHTGVILEGETEWEYEIGTWGDNTSQPKLSYLGNYLYELDISPNIEEFYGTASGEKVVKLALVFRNATGSLQTRPDVYIDIYEPGLNLSISTPVHPFLAEAGTNIPFQASSSEDAILKLFLDEEEIYSLSGSSLSYTFQFSETGDHWVRITATTLEETAADSVFIHVLGSNTYASLPEGLTDGLNETGESSVSFVLFAPGKQAVFVIGDFNQWLPSSSSRMNIDPTNNRWWLSVEGLEPGKEYAFQYLVDGDIRIADPYTHKVLDPANDPYISEDTYPGLMDYPSFFTSEPVSVFQTAIPAYQWEYSSFSAPEKENLRIYELLLRDFLAAHDWKTLTDTLNYFTALGINAIELMPVNEFEGNLSWGYNPSFYFAPDKYYGPADDLKCFIDSCHGRGIAVILDMVLNHSYGQSPLVRLYFDADAGDYGQPTSENPWYNEESPNTSYAWGYDFNHESTATQAFVDSVNAYWLREFQVDGFRFDFTKGFTNTSGDGWNYDASRIAILQRMADRIWAVHPEAYVILEHFTENSEEKELAAYGMLLWGNLNGEFTEAGMGYSSDLSWGSSLEREWTVPHLVSYMESHDEERMMYKMLSWGASLGEYDITDPETALSRMELSTLFLLGIPGPKMIFQFGELGYDYSIEYNDRTGEKPIRWDYIYEHPRHRIYQLFSFLSALRDEYEVFSSSSYSYSLDGAVKRINLAHSSMNVVILGNFDLVSSSINPAFAHTGWWYEYFSGDSINVDDTGSLLSLGPGEYRLYTDERLSTPEFVVSVERYPAIVPSSLRLRAWPNPSPGELNVEIIPGHTGEYICSLYNQSGRILRSWQFQFQAGQTGSFTWNGKDASGRPLPPGLYFLQVRGPVGQGTLRIVRP